MIQVLVVEDSRITRDAIESQIAKSERYVLYASIENAANAEIACLRGCVDLILMDVCTADEESGLKAASKIKQYNPKIKIIINNELIIILVIFSTPFCRPSEQIPKPIAITTTIQKTCNNGSCKELLKIFSTC